MVPAALTSGTRIAIAVLVLSTACSGGIALEAPVTSVDDDLGSPTVRSIAAASHRAGGVGHGVKAVSDAATGTTALATTLGVFVLRADERPVELDRFPAGSQVTDLAIAPDGRTVAVALATPAAVRWYDLTASSAAGSAELGDAPLVHIAFAADGSLAGQTGTELLVWPAGAGTEPLRPTGVTGSVPALGQLTILPDGRIVTPITGTADVLVGSVSDGQVERHSVIGLDGGTLVDAQSSPAGTLAITVGRGDNDYVRADDIVVVDPATWHAGHQVATGRRTSPRDWAIFDSQIAVIVDGGAEVHHTSGAAPVLLARTDNPTLVGVYASDGAIITLHYDGTAYMWAQDLDSPFDWIPTELSSEARFGAASPTLGSGSVSMVDGNGHVTSWQTATGAAFTDDDRFATGAFTSVAGNDPGSMVAVGSAGGRALLYSDQLEPLGEFADGGGRIDDVSFVTGSDDVITARSQRLNGDAFDDTVTRWDTVTSEPVFRHGGDAEPVPGCGFFYNRIRMTPDGSVMAVLSHTYEVSLVDTGTGAELHTFPPHGSTVFDAGFTPNGRRLITSADDSTVRVWDVDDLTLLADYSVANGGFNAIGILSDDTMAVSDITGTIFVVEILTGAVIATMDGSMHRSHHIAVSPDRSMIAASSGDGSIIMWSTSGQLIGTLTGASAGVTSLTFSGNEAILASALDGSVHRWTFDVT
jgi:WD40 repeat protein